MTCREFKKITEALTLWELLRSQEGRLLGHAGACSTCGAWLQQQRMLAANMQTLQARTAASGASPKVEQAVLQAFRQRSSQARPWIVEDDRIAPVAWRLSRFFEVGAYAAIAAAIVVVLFLGVRLWQQRLAGVPVQSQNTNVSRPTSPSDRVQIASSGSEGAQAPATTASDGSKSGTLMSQTSASNSNGRRLWRKDSDDSEQLESTELAQASADAAYTPLMFCDPLSCSSDSQVVRMELASPAGPDSQPQVADVVVGYDGVVRAVRMVN